MSETQFEKMCKKMCKALAKAERELREDNERLREDNELLRELLREVLPCLFVDQCYSELRDKIKKEVSDE